MFWVFFFQFTVSKALKADWKCPQKASQLIQVAGNTDDGITDDDAMFALMKEIAVNLARG